MLRSALRINTPSRERRRSFGRRRPIDAPAPIPSTDPPVLTDAAPSVLTPWQRDAGFDQLFGLSRDALVVSELASGRILRWNAAATQLFGYSAVEVLGRPVELLMPPAVARLHRERVAHYMRTGEVEVLAVRAPLGMPVVTKAGDELRVNMTLAPLQGPSNPRAALLLAFRDATCEKELELQMLETVRVEATRLETESKLRHCEELLRDSARALAAPLARARRTAARMARLTQVDPPAEPGRLALLAQVVEYRTADVEHALEQMLDMTDIQTGAFELRSQRVNLVPLLSRLVAEARGRGDVHRLNFRAPQGLTALCDADRIEAVVRDLINRAIRRNPRGCWIDIDLRRPLAGTALIEVRDYGRPLSHRERERYEHAFAEDRGWVVNRHIVEQHGGNLALELPPEGGVRVSLSLPTHRSLRNRSRSRDHGCIT